MTLSLNNEQENAVSCLEAFCLAPFDEDAPFFLLFGPAGTGKTYCIKELIERVKGRLVFTAPTNKATKVLRTSVTSDDYKPECRTIYSLLGLQLSTDGEIKEVVKPEDPLDLTKFAAVIVDEASMVNAQLMTFIKETSGLQRVKFIFMGDACQLPPVKELASPAMLIEARAELKKVMRHDNAILTLATEIRLKQKHPSPSIKFATSLDNKAEGVWVAGDAFKQTISTFAANGEFSSGLAKAIAWRNVSVDALNLEIRKVIYPDSWQVAWQAGDRITLLSPAKDLEEKVIATTDDEGVVNSVKIIQHPQERDFKVYYLSITLDTNNVVGLYVLHPDSQRKFTEQKEALAAEARGNREVWKQFWSFTETFHQVRHGYATTAHRAQGSTYRNVFVDWRDILLNKNRAEAFRCLYVACTRAQKVLVLN
jgi:hypothetical protein